MPRSRPAYGSEFRREMVQLVQSGRSPEELCKEYEPSAQAIRNWVGQAEREEGWTCPGSADSLSLSVECALAASQEKD